MVMAASQACAMSMVSNLNSYCPSIQYGQHLLCSGSCLETKKQAFQSLGEHSGACGFSQAVSWLMQIHFNTLWLFDCLP